jgi:hypothetical protein
MHNSPRFRPLRAASRCHRTGAIIIAVGTFTAAACSTGSSKPSQQATSASTREAQVTSVATAGAGGVEWPITECGTYSGGGCGPVDRLVDLDKPTFTNPTTIDNPLYPISTLDSVVLLGTVDDVPFRSETTLLDGTATVVWDGREIEVLLVQYAAYSDGRITEVAIDRYAQADDGSVWYFGEDVYDYAAGTVALTEGTWLAGRDGSPAMIMPADPQIGDVYRPETVLGVVFEEITITSIGETVDGPAGAVSGAIIGSELHLDESRSDKTFAPGYGEFFSGKEGEVEALAIASSTDQLDDAEPAELRRALTATWGIAEAARLEEWDAASAMLRQLEDARSALDPVIPLLVAEVLDDSLAQLSTAIDGADTDATVQAAILTAASLTDVQLRFRPVAAVDAARVAQHVQQLRLDATTGDAAGVIGEVATLEWIAQRLDGRLPAAAHADLVAALVELRSAAGSGNLGSAADIAARMGAMVSGAASAVPGWVG